MAYMGVAKKTIELNVEAIKKLKLIFDVTTDKEAVNKAIELVSNEDDIIRTHQSLAGKVELEGMFS
jgi:predicted TIM-barrel fold metal-dependent hydrolase